MFPFNKYIFQEARKVGYELKKSRWFDEVFENLKLMDMKGAVMYIEGYSKKYI